MLWFFLGYYMYIEASRPRTSGQKARFVSPNLPSSSGECLTFYYNMNGRTMGILNVYTQTSGSLGSPVWTKSGNQGSKWQVAQVTLISSSQFQVCKQKKKRNCMGNKMRETRKLKMN